VDGSTESTAALLDLVREGDRAARERLIARYLPMLRRWARGRLPAHARDLNDTNDMVQLTLLAALDRVGEFKSQREGAFLAYLRVALMNSVRSELRRVGRRGVRADMDLESEAVPDALSRALGVDDLLDYETALGKLKPRRREAVILRFEFGMSFAEIAAALQQPSAAAAHMLVSRALVDLAHELGDTSDVP
jgi:RNA polymerase sigma-70 factor (ECF subfamily)